MQNITENNFTFPNTDYTSFILSSTGDDTSSLNSVALYDVASSSTDSNDKVIQYTYKELIEAIHKANSGFKKFGLCNKDIVCILLQNGAQYVILQHAILSNGATVAMTNKKLKESELINLLSTCHPTLYVTDEETLEVVYKSACKTKTGQKGFLIVDMTSDEIKNRIYPEKKLKNMFSCIDLIFNDSGDQSCLFDSSNVITDPSRNVAFIMFSSGTTGLKKAVKITHSNLVSNLLAMTMVSEIQQTVDIFLLAHPFYHCYATIIFGIVMYTKCTGVISIPQNWDMYLKNIKDYRVSYLYLVPPIIHMIMNHSQIKKYDLSSLNTIISSSAPLKRESILRFKKFFNETFNKNITLLQMYGSTESLVTNLANSQTDNESHGAIDSVGKILPGIEYRIIKNITSSIRRDDTDVAAHVYGTFFCRGPNVMHSYMENEHANSEAFMPDGDGGERWLNVGDIMYYDEANNFFVVERLKEMIKYGGLQVPPAELESLLMTHEDIIDAGVIGIPNEEYCELPFAFVVRRKNSILNEIDVMSFIDNLVSDHMRLRGGVRFIDYIPKSPIGKILRKELRKWFEQG